MLDAVIPSLKIEGMALGPDTAEIDLRLLLYEGGSSLNRRWDLKRLDSGELGQLILARLPIVLAIHKYWQDALVSRSLSESSIKGDWYCIKLLVRFADETKTPFILSNAAQLYLSWASHLSAQRGLSQGTKYDAAMTVARVIGQILGVEAKKLQWKTKIRKPKSLGSSNAKENLQQTRDFVQLMLQTIEKLPAEVIYGPLPVNLRFGDAEHSISCSRNTFRNQLPGKYAFERRNALERRERASLDISNKKRAMLINLRLEAEMLVFINQTGCNLTQALQLRGGKFRYQSDGDYVVAKPWKARASHSVELRIYKGYRPHFETFLRWREAIFPGDPDGLTFPFVWDDGDRLMQRTVCNFADTRRLCRALGRPFVNASQLRKTIGNFTKRHASREVASELLGNSQTTFQHHYEEANHQRAVAELAPFMNGLDGMVSEAVGPGGCQSGKPELIPDAPTKAPKPDCEGGSGCLFCRSNRDLRSFDHAWNLASRHRLSLSEYHADRTGNSLMTDHPARLAAERAAAKLEAMAALDDECASWVKEARLRVQEGRYHPHYTSNFESLESGA
jgi:hypothetical protein